jgi:diguanylate cyclase (GGDEF)-like protein
MPAWLSSGDNSDAIEFKRINDLHTHAIGDRVLQEVGALLKSSCRGADFPARMGGEEFALLLSDAALAEANQFCERLRQTFHAHTNWGGIAGLQVTFSIGLAQLRMGESAAELVLRADQALYRARSIGRDCICLAQ